MTLVAELPKPAALPGGPNLRQAGRWISSRLGGALPLLLPVAIVVAWQTASRPPSAPASSSQTAPRVSAMFVPVSPSGTG